MKIIPKDTKPKRTIFKSYTILDFIFMFCFFGIAGLFAMSNIKVIPRIVICLLVLLLGASLFIPINGELTYRGILRAIRFLFERKSYSIEDGSMDNIIPQQAIVDDVIHYPKYFAGVIELECINFELQDAWGQEATLNLLETALKYVDQNLGCDIVKINRPLVLDSLRDNLFEKLKPKLKSNKNLIKANIIASRMDDIADFNTENVVNKNAYYIVLYSDDRDALETMIENVSSFLTQAKIFKQRLKNRDLAIFLKYCNLNDFDERQITEEELEDVIKPNKVVFKKDHYKINDKVAAILAIKDYPLEVGNGWADTLFDINNTKVVCKLKPVDQDKAIKRVDSVIREIATSDANRKASEELNQDVHVATMGKLLTALQTGNEQLFDVSITVTLYADTHEELRELRKGILKKINTTGMRANKLVFSQIDGYINGNISAISKLKRFERGINSKSFVAFFPFNAPLTVEENGIFLGVNEYPVFVDIWKRGQNYQNSNGFIVGKPGSGKSYFAKTLLTSLYSDDCNIYILDPENEYEILCNNLHGDYIDVGNASKGRLNPFHIYNTLSDTGRVADGSETFSAHLRTLESFFKIVFEGASAETLETINNATAIMYRKKNLINVDRYDKIPAENFPTFDDLYMELIEQDSQNTNEILKIQYQKAMMYVQKFVGNGRYSKIWNGYSSITAKADFTVFNFKSLFANKNNLVANAQMLLVLRFLEQEVINKRADKKVAHTVVVADEAHLFIDPKFPVALDFFYQMTKRIRKYKGAFIPITQSISDWLATPEVAHKTTAILRESQYSFIFKLMAEGANDLSKLYSAGGGLNDSEIWKVINAGTGDMFFIANEQQHETFKVITNGYVEALFTDRKVPKNYYKEHFDYIKARLEEDPNWGTSKAREVQEMLDEPSKNTEAPLLDSPK